MFREGKNINYTDGYGGRHTNWHSRVSKSSNYPKDASDIKKEINRLKIRLLNIEKSKTLQSLISPEEVQKLRDDLNFWIEQMNTFDNLVPHKKLKHSYKKVKKEDVLNLLRESIKNETYFVFKEDVAYKLNYKPSSLDSLFMELNREGILSQAHHEKMHDSNRDGYQLRPDECSDWAGDVYYIKREDF